MSICKLLFLTNTDFTIHTHIICTQLSYNEYKELHYVFNTRNMVKQELHKPL